MTFTIPYRLRMKLVAILRNYVHAGEILLRGRIEGKQLWKSLSGKPDLICLEDKNNLIVARSDLKITFDRSC